MEQNARHPAHRSCVRVDGRGVWYVACASLAFGLEAKERSTGGLEVDGVAFVRSGGGVAHSNTHKGVGTTVIEQPA